MSVLFRNAAATTLRGVRNLSHNPSHYPTIRKVPVLDQATRTSILAQLSMGEKAITFPRGYANGRIQRLKLKEDLVLYLNSVTSKRDGVVVSFRHLEDRGQCQDVRFLPGTSFRDISEQVSRQVAITGGLLSIYAE